MVGEVTAASMCCRWALPKGKMFTLILPILFFSYGRYTHAVPYYVRPEPPYFIQQPQSMTLLPGHGYSATLTCAINDQNIISGYNTVEMYWEFNGNLLENPEMLSNVVSSDAKPGQLQLMLQHLDKSNVGRYRCVMQDGLFSIVSESAELTLYEFSGFIESSVFNITAYNGDNIYIDCRANTNSLLFVTWNKDLHPLQSELSHTQRITALPDGVLVISNATDSDAGNYTCRLTLVSQYKEKTIEVKIKTPTAADSQLRFLYKPQNKSAHLNDNNVYLLCVATGNVSSYIWLKDGVSIHDSGIEYQLTAGGSILDFTSITDKVQGVYTCVVRSETNQTINSMAWIQILIPPMIDDSASTSDVLVDIDDIFSLTLNCPIKKSSPTPTILWLHNGLPITIEDFDTGHGLVLNTQKVSHTVTGYAYTLKILSDNGTYQFVLDNIIGMYQCVASNEAGHVIINRRVLFKYKPNPVAQPILHDPVCDNRCGFEVEWNHTDYIYLSKSQRNYVVYMSIDGIQQRAHDCIIVHTTSCVVEYDITEIQFGKYAAAVQAMFSYDYKSPDRTSDLSTFSNVVQLDYSSYPNNAVKPCEMSCNSFTQDSDIYTDVSWNLCPYEDFNGYVDNYIVTLDCSGNYPHASANIFTYTASPGRRNHTFKQVPCFRNCELVVKKRSSTSGGNSNSSITCERTPKLGPQSAVYNVTVNRADNSDDDSDNEFGLKIKISFDLPPVYEICSSDDVSHVLIKWIGSNNTELNSSYDTSVLDYMGHGTVPLQVDDEDRWKAVNVAISFNTSVGSSPWSEWHSVSSATNGDIKHNDFQLEVTDTSYNSVTVRWSLSARARSMIQAKFIINFNYTINDGGSVNGSLEENYTFFNLSAATNYDIVGKVITSDNVTESLTNVEFRLFGNTKTLDESTTDPSTATVPSTAAVPATSREGLSDTVIIAIIVCAAVIVLVIVVALIYRCRSGMCKARDMTLQQSSVVSHHLLEKSQSSITQTTESEIGVPTTPKKELVKEWLNSTDRNNPPGSDGHHAAHSEENVQSEGGQENEINYMLNTISKTKNPIFILEPPPPSRKKNVITAEVHRSSEENEFNSSLFSDKEGDYTKIASNATGASTSKQFVPMENFTSALKASSNFEKTAEFCSTSPKPFLLGLDCGEPLSMQQQDSSAPSSGTAPYLENNEGMYLENEDTEHSCNGTVKGYMGNTAHVSPPPSVLLSSHTSERSSSNYQGEGYVGIEHAILLDAGNMIAPNQSSTHSQNYQTNENATTSGVATSFGEYISTSMDGQYISQTALDSILTETQQNTKPDVSHKIIKKSPEGSVDSDCIGYYDNSPIDV